MLRKIVLTINHTALACFQNSFSFLFSAYLPNFEDLWCGGGGGGVVSCQVDDESRYVLEINEIVGDEGQLPGLMSHLGAVHQSG